MARGSALDLRRFALTLTVQSTSDAERTKTTAEDEGANQLQHVARQEPRIGY